MAYLKINGKEFEARTDFKFQRVANEKYFESDAKGNKQQEGFQVIYGNLLEKDPLYLAYFWDCALSHHKDKPSLNDIEEALLEAAGEEQDFEPLFKDAFGKIDNAGFFKSQVKKYWKNVEMMKDFGEDEKQTKAFRQMLKYLKEQREELTSIK